MKIIDKLLPAFTKIKYVNNTNDENRRTTKLHFQARFSSYYIEKKFFKESQFLFGTQFKDKQQQYNSKNNEI